MRFSERNGYKNIREQIQYEYIGTELRIHLWNAIVRLFLIEFYRYEPQLSAQAKEFAFRLWLEFLHRPIDEFNDFFSCFDDDFKEIYNRFEWFEVFDLIEYLVENDMNHVSSNKQEAIRFINKELEDFNSAYRIVDGYITAVTDSSMIESIESALDDSNYSNVRIHLKTALDLMTNRKVPDYRNSIKESISAVEAYCRVIVGGENVKLGTALRTIEAKHNLHPALKESFNKLFGYTSDSSGIRHALMEESELTYDDALYMLVSCSAFINYLRSKAELPL